MIKKPVVFILCHLLEVFWVLQKQKKPETQYVRSIYLIISFNSVLGQLIVLSFQCISQLTQTTAQLLLDAIR